MLRDRADAEAYVASVCFKHGPPRLTGVELEWLVRPRVRPRPARPPPRCAPRSARTPRRSSTRRPPPIRCPAAPRSPSSPAARSSSPARRFTRLAGWSAPSPPTPRCCTASLAAHGLAVAARAAAPDRPPHRVLDLPRYRAMERRFDRVGPDGRSGMCSTAAVQVCVDAGERAAVAAPLGGRARARPGAARGVRELAAAARAAHGLEVLALAAWLTRDPAPHGAAADPGPGDPARGLGAAGARRTGCCACGATRRAGTRPTGVTFADWVARRADPARRRSPTSTTTCPRCSRRCARAATSRSATSTRSRAGGGRCPPAVLAALLADPAVIDARPAGLRARGRPLGLGRPPRAGRPRAAAGGRPRCSSWRSAALPALAPPSWLVDDLVVMLERRVRRGLCPADLSRTRTRRSSAPRPCPAAPRRPAHDRDRPRAPLRRRRRPRDPAQPRRRTCSSGPAPARRPSPTPSTRPTSSPSTRR